jgi:hypothetical protein
MVVTSRRNGNVGYSSNHSSDSWISTRILDLSSSLDVIHSVDRWHPPPISFPGFAAPHSSLLVAIGRLLPNQRTRKCYTYRTVRHHEAASTGVASASPGVSDCFSPGATTAATGSFRRVEVATTSNTSAIPARHPARRLTNSAHSCGPNTRAVARLTRKVCAGCASLPVSRPTRIAVDSRSKNQENQSGVSKIRDFQGGLE